MKANEQQLQRKPSPLGLFWPNTVAECDTSFLEGSDLYTPTKLPFFKATADLTSNAQFSRTKAANNNSRMLNTCNSPGAPSPIIVPVLSHTGSASSSSEAGPANDTNNETRV